MKGAPSPVVRSWEQMRGEGLGSAAIYFLGCTGLGVPRDKNWLLPQVPQLLAPGET